MKRITLEVSDRQAELIQQLAEREAEVKVTKIESIDSLSQAEFIQEFKAGIEELNAVNRGERQARAAQDLLDELRGKDH